MSSRKGKVAGDREEKVAGDWESNREEKKGEKNKDERVLYALKMGEKQSPTEKRKGGKKQMYHPDVSFTTATFSSLSPATFPFLELITSLNF